MRTLQQQYNIGMHLQAPTTDLIMTLPKSGPRALGPSIAQYSVILPTQPAIASLRLTSGVNPLTLSQKSLHCNQLLASAHLEHLVRGAVGTTRPASSALPAVALTETLFKLSALLTS